jgi:hypothetical protein
MWKILKFNISQSIDNPWLYSSIHCVRSHLAFSHLVCSLLTSHLFKSYFILLLVIELNQLRCPLHYGEGACMTMKILKAFKIHKDCPMEIQ